MRTQDERAYPTHWEADVVLRDGGTARIRPIAEDDVDRLLSFYEQVSDESKYYRFFAPYPRLSDRDVQRFTHHDYVNRVALAATVGGEFIATVRYDRIDTSGRPVSSPSDATGKGGRHAPDGETPDEAEVAFLVRDDHQGRGVASALLEHIAAVARERGIGRFTAEILPANHKMIKVFTDAGYSQKRSFEDGSVHLTFPLEPTEQSLAVMRAREQRAESRSVQRLLAPGCVAVVGAGRGPGGTGRSVLENLRAGGYEGRVYAVNNALPEGGQELAGVPAYRSVADLPQPVDLAVIAVPAAAVESVARDCGEAGVQGLVVLSSGFGRAEQRELVRLARSYGMRIIGPNAFGVMNTAPSVRLNATPSPQMPIRGRVGLFTQSGAIGIALLEGLHSRGAGLSTFVSAGNRADVSGNDVLQYWDEDQDTDVALLYLESFGNPRKFTRLAKRTAARKPVVVVRGSRHSGSAPPPGHAAPVSRTPAATVTSLLRQAGVIMVDTVTQMIDAAMLLSSCPLPAGRRTSVIGNAESLSLLTFDACLTDGLRPRPVVDLTTAATPADYRRAVGAALEEPGTDAVVVTVIPWVGATPVEELADALREAAATADKPVVVVDLAVEGLEAALVARGIPCYPAPERAVRALAEAARYSRWRREAESPGRVPEFDVDERSAEKLLGRVTEPDDAESSYLGELDDAGGLDDRDEGEGEPRVHRPAGGGRPAAPAADSREARPTTVSATTTERYRSFALGEEDASTLLSYYGVSVLPVRPAPSADDAVAAARDLGYPVALKTTAPHLRHRADLGGVRLDLGGEQSLRRAYDEITQSLGKPAELRPVVQAMAPRGVDTVVRAAFDPAIGAVLSFGLAGPPSELLGDTAHRLVPATDRDVAELVRSIRSAPILFGWRGAQPVDTGALEMLLLRVSRLLDDNPEIVAVDLEPVTVAPKGLNILGATVRVAEPAPLAYPGARRLPAY